MTRIVLLLLLFKEYHCALVLNDDRINGSNTSMYNGLKPINIGSRPEYMDWRERNAVSPVKNQLGCAACWAFSTIACIESQLQIKLSEEIVLSEQFLLDCDPANAGCGYGSLLQTFANIVNKFGGVLRDSDYYPYEGTKRECRWSPDRTPSLLRSPDDLMSPNPIAKPVPVIGFRRVRPDEEVMAEFLYNYGPLTAAINSASMGNYQANTIDEPTDEQCSPNNLDHAVLIVGYSVYESANGKRVPYWIIKNSWGTNWGDRGFYYLVRGRNACGIASDVSIAFVD